MFDKLDTATDVFMYKLGSALTMENDSLEMLEELRAAAQRAELKDLFEAHAQETRGQIANVERCFEILGNEPNDSPSPATKGLAKGGSSTIKMTDPSVVDIVALSGALETEHYEIAVYEMLITAAESMGQAEVASLLRQNLEQEVAAADKIRMSAKLISQLGVSTAPTAPTDT